MFPSTTYIKEQEKHEKINSNFSDIKNSQQILLVEPCMDKIFAVDMVIVIDGHGHSSHGHVSMDNKKAVHVRLYSLEMKYGIFLYILLYIAIH